jgi:hypothetical protein
MPEHRCNEDQSTAFRLMIRALELPGDQRLRLETRHRRWGLYCATCTEADVTNAYEILCSSCADT